MKRSLVLAAIAAPVSLASQPALALSLSDLLKAAFGSDDPKDLGVPIFVGLIALAAAMLWTAMIIGKRRQRREIDAYNARLAAYSDSLRKASR